MTTSDPSDLSRSEPPTQVPPPSTDDSADGATRPDDAVVPAASSPDAPASRSEQQPTSAGGQPGPTTSSGATGATPGAGSGSSTVGSDDPPPAAPPATTSPRPERAAERMEKAEHPTQEADQSQREPERRPAGPRIVALANQKGGVGKTTTTVSLGAAAAELGHRVLVVDLDPQGNASTGLGINPRSLEASMYDVLLHDVPIDDAIEAASVRNLFVAPANLDLAGAEIELVPAFSREMRLKNAIASVSDDYDLVLIDCPPSLGLLTVNAFAAASEVMVPVQCEYYALEGLGQLLRNVDLVQRNLNSALRLSAIVLVMYDARTNLAQQVSSEVREHFGSVVCRTVIPRTVRLSEAPSFGQPITVFDPTSRGAVAYRDLAKEFAGEPA